MVKLVVFDLDDTLAELGKGILPEDIRRLKAIEDRGVTIAICSGKPTYYLCGFMRQVGLKQPILIGENGAVIQFGVDLPPEKFHILPYSDEAKQAISFIGDGLKRILPGMWYQPNMVGLTPFPKNEMEFEKIDKFLYMNAKSILNVDVYRHSDSFDFVPHGINKKAGLAYLSELLGVSPREIAAVGDGENDYPMFEYAGCSVGVNVRDNEKVDWNFGTLAEALEWLIGRL